MQTSNSTFWRIKDVINFILSKCLDGVFFRNLIKTKITEASIRYLMFIENSLFNYWCCYRAIILVNNTVFLSPVVIIFKWFLIWKKCSHKMCFFIRVHFFFAIFNHVTRIMTIYNEAESEKKMRILDNVSSKNNTLFCVVN